MQRLAEAFDSFYRHGQCVYLSANFFGNLYSAVSDDNSAIGWKLLLAAYAAIALAAIILLIIAMVKYPKPASKPA